MLLRSAAGALEAAGETGREVTLDQRADLRAAMSHTAGVCRRVLVSMYELGGSTPLYRRNRVEQIFRDGMAALQHANHSADLFEAVGRVRFGHEPGVPLYCGPPPGRSCGPAPQAGGRPRPAPAPLPVRPGLTASRVAGGRTKALEAPVTSAGAALSSQLRGPPSAPRTAEPSVRRRTGRARTRSHRVRARSRMGEPRPPNRPTRRRRAAAVS
ncbi:hypothetical protein [Streptomyces zhihengii]|uniref:hypothetical protein n=1 Tax=Streptomyces zhihengii TaxID=1818004 RepID=UPI0033AF8607